MKVLYTSGQQLGPRLAYLAAAAQLPLWLNLADWSLRDLRESETETSSTSTSTSTPTSTSTSTESHSKKAPLIRRIATSLLCLGAGAAFAGVAHVYASRLVASVDLVSNSKAAKNVRITTHALNWRLLGSNEEVADARSLRCLERVVFQNNPSDSASSFAKAKEGKGNKAFYLLRNMQSHRNYLLPRDGIFHDPNTFDSLFNHASFKN
ncbi:hypothetical protein HDU79_004707 [Rhizoclosmatium sp. JEL0117]|nr:hypothetical protein HDU79_004707 [Rhizoclosmatium sp. JEL0117]